MPCLNLLQRVVALTVFCLWAPYGLAQIVTPISQSRLAPIPDQAADLKPLQLGQTRVDYSAMSPIQRAEFVNLMANLPADLSLRAWNGEGSKDSVEQLQIDRLQIALDTAQTDGVWWFEYVNNGRSARHARWQISRLPFPEDLSSWRVPAGLVSQGKVPNVLRGTQANRFKLQIGNFLLGANADKLDLLNSPGQTVTSALHSEFPASRLYLRVLVLGRNGKPVTRPSNTVTIDVDPVTDMAAAHAALPQIQGTPELQPARAAAADYRCHFIATRAFVLPTANTESTVETGDAINACLPPPVGLLGRFEKHFGSATQLDTLIRDWDANRYVFARDETFEAVFRNFGGPEGGCNSHCRQAMQLALDRGAAALGIPRGSSVPDPNINAGLEYLRYLIIDALRISDLPEVVHEQASTKAITVFRDAMLSPGHAPPPFEPSLDQLSAAPRLTLTLSAGESETTATYLQIRDPSRNPRVQNTIIPVPAIPAGKQISVPIKLPSTDIPEASATATLAAIGKLTDGINDPGQLLLRVDSQLRDTQIRQARSAKQARRGNYDLELAWRSAEGIVVSAMRLRCKASNGKCRIR